MPNISGIDVRELTVDVNGSPPEITFKFAPELPTFIDTKATTENRVVIGSAIINDGNPDNNIIVIDNFKRYLNEVIWLKIIVHHPTLEKYDFKIDVAQDHQVMTTYVEHGDLSHSRLIYEGFILKKASA